MNKSHWLAWFEFPALKKRRMQRVQSEANAVYQQEIIAAADAKRARRALRPVVDMTTVKK